MKHFTTHTREVVFGKRLKAALNAVADDWAQLAFDIHKEDAYASHVTQETKDANRAGMIADAEEIRKGNILNFTIWQRVNAKLTGECIPLLQKRQFAK